MLSKKLVIIKIILPSKIKLGKKKKLKNECKKSEKKIKKKNI